MVIIRGTGRAFCAGADLAESGFARERTGEISWIARRHLSFLGQRMADAIENMNAVTVVRVQGHAVGGAVVLVSCCDIRFAADEYTRKAFLEYKDEMELDAEHLEALEEFLK